MPSSSTITAFHSFTANTRARASQVQTNFDNFRGHFVPINTDTASASNLTHNLGSDDHRWSTVYTNFVDIYTSTNTATLHIRGDDGATTGAFLFQIESVTKAKIDTSGVDGSYLKAGSVAPAAKNDMGAGTITASAGQMGLGTTLSNYQVTQGGSNIQGSTITIATSGRPVMVGFRSAGAGVGGIYSPSTIGAAVFSLCRAGTTIATFQIGPNAAGNTLGYPPISISHLDIVASGTQVYHWTGKSGAVGGIGILDIVQSYAFEL